MGKLVFGVAFFLFLFLMMAGLGLADEPSVLKLVEETQGVQTSGGVLNLVAGTQLGGNPLNYVILTRDTVMATEQGPVTVPNGTIIDCDPMPGEPDPCGFY